MKSKHLNNFREEVTSTLLNGKAILQIKTHGNPKLISLNAKN
jgi:hypothetical protein